MDKQRFEPSCVAIVDTAIAVANKNRNPTVDPEHVLSALLASADGNLLLSEMSQWQRDDLTFRLKSAPQVEGFDGVVHESLRFVDMLLSAQNLAGNGIVKINHLALAARKSFNGNARFGMFDDGAIPDEKNDLSAEEKKAENERIIEAQREEEQRYALARALEASQLVEAKSIAMSFSFDGSTGKTTVDLKIEAGPGVVEAVDGQKTVKPEAARAIIELVGRTLGQKPREPDPVDGGDNHLGVLDGDIFSQ